MNTVCTHCQAINRIPDDRIEDAAKCGRCGHDLFDGEVINATGETLDKLLKDDLPVVIDFWAPWCGPCRNFAPIFEDVAQERSGKVRFVKVNTEAERELSSRFGAHLVPRSPLRQWRFFDALLTKNAVLQLRAERIARATRPFTCPR